VIRLFYEINQFCFDSHFFKACDILKNIYNSNMQKVILQDNYKEFIDYSVAHQAMNVHHPIQVEVIDEKFNGDFMKFGHKICDHERIEELSGWQRRPSQLKFEDVIDRAHTAIKCGMKVNHFPQWKINPWDQWEDGYIEFYIRMDGFTPGNEIFIWQDIRMKKLPKILKEFAFKLEYWKI
jgi:hypothetical protein